MKAVKHTGTTHHQGVEEELRELKSHVQSLLETAKGFYFYWLACEPGTPPKTRIVMVSPSIIDVMGIKEANDFESWFAGFHPDDAPRIMAAHQKTIETGALFDQEARWYHAARGEWVWLRAMSQPLYNAAGVLTHFNGICIDITPQRQSAEALKQREAQLQEAELRYRTVADFTADWEYWEAPDGSMRYVSPACETITGYNPEAFTKDVDLLHKIVLVEDLPVWQEHRQEAFGGKACAPIQFRIVCRDGGVRWLEHACRPVVAEGGAFLGFRGSNRDITDRKQTEAKLAQKQEELARVGRVNDMGELVASLAHELNQPLAAALTDTETAKMLLNAPKPDLNGVRAILDDIAASQERAGEIVRRVRAQVSPAAVIMCKLDLNGLVEESVKLIQNRAVLDNIQIGLVLKPELPPIKGDCVQIIQVLTNLMMNAMDAMRNVPSGQCEVTVNSIRRSDGMLAVEVADKGPGVPPEKLASIFEPFYTTKAGGMGMGLAICHSITAAHGGELTVRNNPDGGATFTFAVPVMAWGGS